MRMSHTMTNEDGQAQRRADEIFDSLDDYDRVCLAQLGTAFTTYEDEGGDVCAWLNSRAHSWRCAQLTRLGA